MDLFYNYSAVPQLVLDPVTDTLIEANQEACRLLRRDRDTLKNMRVTELFAPDLPQLFVFTDEVIEYTRGVSDGLFVNIDGETLGVEVVGRSSKTGEECLLHVSLQLVRDIVARRERSDAQAHYDSGLIE
jgi:hypothetical protein